MNKFNNMALKWKLGISFAIPLILFIGIASTVYVDLGKMIETSKWVNHTYDAIDLGNKVTGSMVNMETGLRGYLVSGKEEFLEPYTNGLNDYAKILDKVKKTVSDNAQQVGRLEKADTLKQKWISEHAEVSMGYRREVSEGAEAANIFKVLAARTVGKEKFDGFRASLAKVHAEFTRSGDIYAEGLSNLILMDMINQETGQRGYLLSVLIPNPLLF